MEERGLALTSPANNSNGFRLDGKAAIVTGGASGIGRAIAHRFAMSGACVHVLDIDASELENSAQEISDAGGTARAYACDVSRQDEVDVVLQRIVEHERVHILVNNAAIAHIGKLENTSEEDFDKVFNVNVKGFYNCMLASVEHMKNMVVALF